MANENLRLVQPNSKTDAHAPEPASGLEALMRAARESGGQGAGATDSQNARPVDQ